MATNSDRNTAPRSRVRPRSLATLLALFAAGCGPPQVEPGHRELVLRLATATSTKDRALLDAAAAEADRYRADGELAGAEAAAFDAIIAAGREGDWERARRRSYDLRDAQRPTEEDIERVRSRVLPPLKTPGTAGSPRPSAPALRPGSTPSDP